MGSDLSDKIKEILAEGNITFKTEPLKMEVASAEVRFKKQGERGWDRRGKKRDLRPIAQQTQQRAGDTEFDESFSFKRHSFAEFAMDMQEMRFDMDLFRSMYQGRYSPGFTMPPQRTLLNEEWSSDREYKTYTDLNDYMANRIACDTGQEINLVARTLRAARSEGREYIMVEDIRPAEPFYKPKLNEGWEKFWSTFKYKPGFTFKYGEDPWSSKGHVWVSMTQEDVFNPGKFVPVSAKMTLPPWEGEEEARLYTRNKIIFGLEQHEIDEWLNFDGDRAFDPHAEKNKHLQIIDGKV